MRKMILAVLSVPIFACAGSESDITMYLKATPANPIVGETVVWSVVSLGGPGPKSYSWNADINEFPQLYDWTNTYPFLHSTSITNVYHTAGTKEVSVTAWSENRSVSRTLSLNVADGRLTLLYPKGDQVWHVGRTYTIR